MDLGEDLFLPWLDEGLDLFDTHTHIGRNDPDGYKQTPAELTAALEICDARAFTFPMHEPDGYPAANDEALAAQEASDGRLVAFCRVDPKLGDAAVREAERMLDAGARGIKLHPRAEAFGMDAPAVRGLTALAHERRLPLLIHAGRGIPALGVDTVRLSGEFPDARLILAHCAVSDLAWLPSELGSHPNVYVDTSWWMPADFTALMALVPPGQILWASDSPYASPTVSAVQTLRLARQAGHGEAAVRSIAGGQAARLADGRDPLDLGAAIGPGAPLHPLMERVVGWLTATLGQLIGGAEDVTEFLSLGRLACGVGTDSELAPVCSAVLELLDRFEAELAPPPPGRRFPAAIVFLMAATIVARTPDVALGPLPDAPPPARTAT